MQSHWQANGTCLTKIFLFYFLLPFTFASSDLPLCSNNTHTIHGDWILSNESNQLKSFVCCGGGLGYAGQGPPPYDYQQLPEGLCSPNHTLPLEISTGYFDLGAQCGDDCCICDRTANTRFKMTDRESYKWAPQSCRLLDWNASLFCSLLSQRRVLMMGDSTMQQTASTLMSMIAAGRGNCGPQIMFVRSDHLFGFEKKGKKTHFETFLESLEPEIYIITAGAHLQDDGDMNHILYHLSHYLASRREERKKMPCAIIWKTQNPGHVNCQSAKGPYPWGYTNASHDQLDKYNWKRFLQFDDMVRQAAPAMNVSLLDMSPLWLRPDGHILGPKDDCLHYCQPGPINLFSVLLLQMLYNGDIPSAEKCSVA